jgi:signal transduction histidine kinase
MYAALRLGADAAAAVARYRRGVRVLDRARRASPWTIDAVLATVFIVLGLLTTAASESDSAGVTYEHRDATAYALVLAATAPHFFRRRFPLPVFLASATAVVVLAISEYNEGFLPFAVLVGAYTVGAYCRAREVVVAAVLMAALLTAVYVGDAPGFGRGELATNLAIFGTAMLLGWTMQSRRVRLEILEREREEEGRRAAADERLRIAQELHDVVAHSLGVIAVQAGVGMHMIDTDPDEARRALEHISRTSRSSLAEIRRLLGVVRSGEGAAYAPTPGLADLPRLVAEVNGAGLAVDLEVEGEATGAPAGVELTAYRIVQEALTNTLRHAGPARATVRLAHEPGLICVEVIDNGHGPDGAGPAGGHGLVGMRERVAVYGGTLEAGRGPVGGFRVVARLPFEEDGG